MSALLTRPPLLIAIAGSNGAGKTTFYNTFLKKSGLRFVNADMLAAELGIGAYEAAALAETARCACVRKGESFVFETVFSDPAGDKIAFLKNAAKEGYTVVLIYIGIPNVETSEDRVAIRVSQGGHDVPLEKLRNRFLRTLENLKRAIVELPRVIVFDNNDNGLKKDFRRVAEFRNGVMVQSSSAGWEIDGLGLEIHEFRYHFPALPLTALPDWLKKVL